MTKQTKMAKTYIERMGFKDSDLKTSKHDEICLWLTKEYHIYRMLISLFKLKPLTTYHTINPGFNENKWDWDKKTLIDASSNENKKTKLLYEDVKKQFNEHKRFTLSFEKPITAHNGFMLGFIDLQINTHTSWNDSFERSVGIYDVNNNKKYDSVYVEVKSKINSFGELLREINFYRENINTPNSAFLVVAPECDFVEELKSQGVFFYKYVGDKQ